LADAATTQALIATAAKALVRIHQMQAHACFLVLNSLTKTRCRHRARNIMAADRPLLTSEQAAAKRCPEGSRTWDRHHVMRVPCLRSGNIDSCS
jgi:hypothetical protein